MNITLQRWGNSQGIRIPKVILDAVNWSENEPLVISAENDRLVIEKAQKHKNIVELFAGYDGDYTPSEIDWGAQQGGEVW